MGAWIETKEPLPKLASPTVAPHVGAWIETKNQFGFDRAILSHPMWVRGLKQTEIANNEIYT